MYEILRKSYRIAGKIFTIKQTVVQSSYIIGLVYQMTDARSTVMFEWDFRSFSGLHHLRVSNHLKAHIILYNTPNFKKIL
jgi:hypothetical protein